MTCKKKFMKVFGIFFLSSIVLIVCCTCNSQDISNGTELEDSFKNPPNKAKPQVYWWWLNGSTDTLRMRKELNDFKNAGISEVLILDIGGYEIGSSGTTSIVKAGTAFISRTYLKKIAFAVKVAGNLGMKVGLTLASSWEAGGSWVPPKYAAKSIYFSKKTISKPGKRQIKLSFPKVETVDKYGRRFKPRKDSLGRPAFHKEIAVIAFPVQKKDVYPDSSKIFNISKYFDPQNGILTWKVPKGEWEIYRYIVANSGQKLKHPSLNSDGYIIDPLDGDALAFHENYFINHLSLVIDNLSKSALSYFYLPSFEAVGTFWTPSLSSVFKKEHGYDLYKFLPSLNFQKKFKKYKSKYKNDKVVRRFLDDWNNTISNMMIEHYQKGRSVANKAGLKLSSESGGPGGGALHNVPVEALGALGAVDLPRGEVWYKSPRFTQKGLKFAKADSFDVLDNVKGPAAAGHIYKKGTVEMETFTSNHHWEEGPFDLKPVADHAFIEGMSRVVIHGSAHNPSGTGFPGIAYYAGTHYTDKRVWWPEVKPFNNYLARISYMAQQGKFISDVLYYHGDQAPNIVRPKNADFSVAPGYDYEVINKDVLLNKLKYKDGLFVLPGVGTYHLLEINPSDKINPLVMEKLVDFAKKGAIILGKKPTQKLGLGFKNWDTVRLQKEIAKNWLTLSGTLTRDDLSKGKIIDGASAAEVLHITQIKPDVSYSNQKFNSPLDYIHYKKRNLDYYFVCNVTNRWLTKKVFFRQHNKIPEIWDPVTGSQVSIPIYQRMKDQISIPLTFKPHDAYFVVFKNSDAKPLWEGILNSEGNVPEYSLTKGGLLFREKGSFYLKSRNKTEEFLSDIQTYPIKEDWKLSFPKNWGGPESIVFPKLVSWTDSKNQGIKYFSGTATYKKTFSLPFDPDTLSSDFKVYLNLGNVGKIAKTWINDHSLGIAWNKPYEYDVTEYIKSDSNHLTVKISNVWANRIIGDAILDQDFTTTNIKKVRGIRWKDISLVPSGLLGPVTIQLRRLLKIKRER